MKYEDLEDEEETMARELEEEWSRKRLEEHFENGRLVEGGLREESYEYHREG